MGQAVETIKKYIDYDNPFSPGEGCVNVSELQCGWQEVLCDLRRLVGVRLNGNLGEMLI